MSTCLALGSPCSVDAGIIDEPEMVARLKAGDEDAYETLFRTHSRAMMAVARRFLGDTDDATDAVQDAFVSAFKAIGSFEGEARLSTWLHRITVNACLMKLRRRRRSRLVPLDASVPARAADSDDVVSLAETCGQVRAGIERLPKAYREVVRLRDLEGLNTEETAGRLGTSEAAVKVRLHRARQALMMLLRPLVG